MKTLEQSWSEDIPQYIVLSGLGIEEFKYDPSQPRAPKGSTEGGKWVSGKVSRALATHKPSTREKQRVAESQEVHVAEILGLNVHGDNDPVDVSGEMNGKRHAVEVKTFISNSNDKVTVHPDSLKRKTAWARKNKAQLHMVVVDLRSGTRELYYRRGVGSFRLGTLTPVVSAGHLKALVMGVGEFAEWNEEDHPRDDDGQFAPKGTPAWLVKEAIDNTESKKLINEFAEKHPWLKVEVNDGLGMLKPGLVKPSLDELELVMKEFPDAARYLEKVEIHPLGNNWGEVSDYGVILRLNSSLLSDPQVLRDGLNQVKRFHDGMTDIAYVARHEFGHVVDYWAKGGSKYQLTDVVRASGFGMVNDTHREWLRSRGWSGELAPSNREARTGAWGSESSVSGYATTNQAEWFAETFAATRYGDKITKKHSNTIKIID